ncbi:TPA: hypothetical protein ACQ2HY_001697, partial [Klebsiella pneumoniae]
SFPGNRPPEIEVYQNAAVKEFLHQEYGIDFDWLIQRKGVEDHHLYTKTISEEVECEEEVVRILAIKKYIDVLGEQFDNLVDQIVRK